MGEVEYSFSELIDLLGELGINRDAVSLNESRGTIIFEELKKSEPLCERLGIDPSKIKRAIPERTGIRGILSLHVHGVEYGNGIFIGGYII